MNQFPLAAPDLPSSLLMETPGEVEALRESQRTPASGIAHDLNNILAPIPALASGAGEMILVVDDEIGIRVVSQRTLESCGYRIVVAKNGSDGLAAFVRNQADIAAVVTDLMMPVMDGPAMVEEIRRRAPTLPIIAMTGLHASEKLARVRELGVQGFIAKPFTFDTLRRTLAEVLAARA